MRADQVRDAMGEDARLPRARAGDYEKRAVNVQNGLALRRIEVGKKVFVGRDAHASMLAAVSARVTVAVGLSARADGLLTAAGTSARRVPG